MIKSFYSRRILKFLRGFIMKQFQKFCVTLMFMVLVYFSTVPVYASLANESFVWYQSVGRKFVYSDFIGRNEILFEGVATSPNYGTFKVELQRKLFLNVWYRVPNSYVYTVSQHSNQTLNLRTQQYVYGQYFVLRWYVGETQRKSYRVVLQQPTAPQVTVFTQVYFFEN